MIKFYGSSAGYQAVGARLVSKSWPGCEKYEFRSDAYYECYVREVSFSLWHPSGTCRMSRRGDPNAVVDNRLRVIGVENLRVVDASVMPRITNGNTNAPTVMIIAEKGSDMIIQYWGGVTYPPRGRRPCRNESTSNSMDVAIDEN